MSDQRSGASGCRASLAKLVFFELALIILPDHRSGSERAVCENIGSHQSRIHRRLMLWSPLSSGAGSRAVGALITTG